MERVWAGLRYYADLHPEIKTGDVRFLITGHSLGGAAANLLAAKMTLIQERGTGEWEAMGWSVPPAQRNIYAFTFGSLNAFDRHYDTSRFTHIKNIFNYYDTYGPNGDGFLGLVYPASGGKSCLYKFGPVLVFQKRYEGQFKTDDYCNHLMPGYLDAIRTDAVSRAALRNGLRLIIACPVDVEVYNSQGTLIGAIRDDVVDGTLAPYHAFVHQGAKYLYMPQDEDLRFRMIATGEGEMEFLAQPFGSVEGGGEEGYTLFRHVALTPGKVLFSQVGDPVPVEQVELFVQDEAGNFTAQVLTDGQEVPVAQKPSGGGGGGGTSSTHAVVLRAGEGGSLSVHPGTAAEGDMVTITPAAEAGYEVGSLTVIDSRGNALELHNLGDGRFTFRMPGTQVTVTASFAKRSALPFADVSEEDWFHPAVTYVWRAGLMSGTSPERFAPRETLTRGMIAQILYAWEGKPEEMGTGAFADVSAGAWYAPGVNWAQANGIVAGMGGGRFAPDSPLTREQLAAILYRYAQYKGWDVRPGANASLTAYGDADRISAYAVPALEWACGSGLISGRGDGILAPADTATRAETAQILMGLMERHAA